MAGSFRYAMALAMAILFVAPSIAADAPAAQTPWLTDTALAKTMWSEVQTSGLSVLGSHLPELEKALAGAKQSIALAASGPGTHYVLTDGPADTLAALTLAAADSSFHGQTFAIENPYWQISLMLGSYYNEVGKPDDALRVLDAGLALSTLPDLYSGAHMPDLEGERGAAFILLKRWPDALAAYDQGLTGSDLDAAMKAHLQRGRGFVLTELQRLDEAERAYRTSLEFEPGNARALNELAYIAGLRAGKPPTATELAPAPAATPAQPPTPAPAQ